MFFFHIFSSYYFYFGFVSNGWSILFKYFSDQLEVFSVNHSLRNSPWERDHFWESFLGSLVSYPKEGVFCPFELCLHDKLLLISDWQEKKQCRRGRRGPENEETNEWTRVFLFFPYINIIMMMMMIMIIIIRNKRAFFLCSLSCIIVVVELCKHTMNGKRQAGLYVS